MFSQEAEAILLLAHDEAKERKHEFVLVEHILYSLIKNLKISNLLFELGVDVAELDVAISEELDDLEQIDPRTEDYPIEGVGTLRVIQSSLLQSQFSNNREVQPVDLLVALMRETESLAYYHLTQLGLTKIALLERIAHDDEFQDPSSDLDFEDEDSKPNKKDKESEKFLTNMTELAEKGEFDPLIGRNEELERIIQILSRRTKNNPLLVGDQGVGKTSIIEGLAQKIANKELPKKLGKLTLLSLDIGSLLAGTKYRGDFEHRLKSVIGELTKYDHPVLFIDEIHNIVGAGSTNGSTLDAANLLKPILSKNKIGCIGSTTFEEFKNHFSKDRALARRFQKIDILPPSKESTIKILKGLKSRFESHHEIKYTEDSIKKAVELSDRYITDRFLPDKAIDVIDEAGSKLSLKGGKTVTAKDIEEIVSKIARVPVNSVDLNESEKLKRLEGDLKSVVYGQEEAISQLVQAIKRSRAGLRPDHKTIGSFLFTGPTGVGKTEIAKQLAKSLNLELVRFDMSEYMEKHTVSRLIGAPPGYVGFDQGGLLTDAIIKQPYSVLLLDEIEKAHPDIFNILLQVMDNAQLTDTSGRKVDFRNIILIMTSNVGSEELSGKSIGFTSLSTTLGKIAQGIIDKTFKPEFRNRLDKIIKFNQLNNTLVEKIVDKMILELETLLVKKRVTLSISSEARRFLAEKGYNQQLGARPLTRAIQELVTDPLTEMILFGELNKGGNVEINFDTTEQKLVFNCSFRETRSQPQELVQH